MEMMEAALGEDIEQVSSTTSSGGATAAPIRVTVSTVEESREVQADRDEPVHGAIQRAFGAQCRIHQVLFTGANKSPRHSCCDHPRQALTTPCYDLP